jgi:hypothetical protein
MDKIGCCGENHWGAERHLDPDAYLDEMDRLEQQEQLAEHLLDQQEKHDD